MALGVPDELYWTLTPPELRALMEGVLELRRIEEREAWRRAGLVAATLINLRPGRRPGSRTWVPEDFLVGSGKAGGNMDAETYIRLRAIAEGERQLGE